MSEDKPKRKKQFPKLCTECNIEKPPNGWTEETYNDSNSTICKKCVKKATSKSQNKNQTKQKTNKKNKRKATEVRKMLSGQKKVKHLDDNRSIIIKPGLYCSVPYSYLETDLSIELFTSIIEKEGPILVTLFRDSLSKREFDGEKLPMGEMEQRKLNFMQSLEEKFPNHNVKSFDWPQNYRSSFDNYRSTHPYISYHCRAAAIIHEANQTVSKEKFESALFDSIHDHTLKLSKDRWVIVGDETGTLDEFESNNTNLKSTMCWLAIPPGVSLDSLPPSFHCSGSGGNSDYKKGIEHLSKHDGILMFTFAYEQGEKVENTTKIGESPHLNFWQDTLPLVLEKVSTECSTEVGVDIFVEQVFQLESGLEIIEPIINKFAYENLRFEQLWIVSKGEHPWIGYPDALGHCINQTKQKYLPQFGSKFEKIERSVFERIHKSPYRQKGLTEVVISALINKSRPLHLLQSLYSIEANDLRDYIRPFFGNAIQESLDSLNVDEWQDLLEHIDKKSSESKKGQRVTALIHDYIDIDKSLEKLENSPYVQFDLLRMMLGTSNHRGAMAEGLRCKQICEKMFESGFDPTHEKMKKFENILPGLQDNMFNFNLENIEIPEYDKKMETQEIHKLGTIAQSLGLSGIEDNLDIAIQIESSLANHGDNRHHKARHSILLAELLTDKNKYSKAKEILDGIQYSSQNSFLFAAQLKCYSLGEFELPKDENYVEDFMKLLDEDHPSQRIAYWYARWALVNDKQAEEYTQQCIKHLLSLTDVPLFSHDAPGVILACELIDLEVRGYELDFDTSQFYEMIKSNSQPSTLEWLEQNTPNEEDWLAPLNFNYR